MDIAELISIYWIGCGEVFTLPHDVVRNVTKTAF